jgi:hypothetical protein
MSDTGRVLTAVALRADQWDLIVLSLGRISAWCEPGNLNDGVDKLAKQFTRRRCNETVADIQAVLPEAGK